MVKKIETIQKELVEVAEELERHDEKVGGGSLLGIAAQNVRKAAENASDYNLELEQREKNRERANRFVRS